MCRWQEWKNPSHFPASCFTNPGSSDHSQNLTAESLECSLPRLPALPSIPCGPERPWIRKCIPWNLLTRFSKLVPRGRRGWVCWLVCAFTDQLVDHTWGRTFVFLLGNAESNIRFKGSRGIVLTACAFVLVSLTTPNPESWFPTLSCVFLSSYSLFVFMACWRVCGCIRVPNHRKALWNGAEVHKIPHMTFPAPRCHYWLHLLWGYKSVYLMEDSTEPGRVGCRLISTSWHFTA